MARMGERFEMRVDAETLERIDDWRSRQPGIPSRAEGMRRLVEVGLRADSPSGVRFSDGERLIATMLADIQRHQRLPNPSIDSDLLQEMISGGHYWAAPIEYPGIYHGEDVSQEDARFVIEVLSLWDILERSYKDLSVGDGDRIKEECALYSRDFQFPGFDGNNECTYLSVALFLVEDLGRFSDFKGRELNSHMPTASSYARMLERFDPIRRTLMGSLLTGDQILEVVGRQMTNN
jgi:uncharacterized protein